MKMHNAPEYKDIINQIEMPISDGDKEEAKQYAKRDSIIMWIAVIMTIAHIATRFLERTEYVGIVTLAMLIMVWLLAIRRIRNFKKISNILWVKSDPHKYLSVYCASVAYRKSGHRWDEVFYRIGYALCCAGRVGEAEKIAVLYPKYFTNASVMQRLYYEFLQMEIALYRMDTQRLEMHFNELCQCEKRKKLRKLVQNFVDQRKIYLYYMKLWDQCEYNMLYEQISLHPCKMALEQAKKNYYLYRVAKKIGEDGGDDWERKAREHRDVVLRWGGTSWYRQNVEL